MSRESLGLDPQLQNYLLDNSLRDDDLARELRDLTGKRSDSSMQIAPEQGQFMALLVKLCGARRILEVGTFTGYSALKMAEALPADGSLVALDINPDTTKIAREYWERAGVGGKIELVLGPALQSLSTLDGPFDIVFIDADKSNYDNYYERGLELLRPGGLIILDNMLWGGRVADTTATDADTVAIRALNHKLRDDRRVDLSLLPLADGITLARKRAKASS